ncbi:hypothetical protein PG987_002887 [Apiospora arundinis]
MTFNRKVQRKSQTLVIGAPTRFTPTMSEERYVGFGQHDKGKTSGYAGLLISAQTVNVHSVISSKAQAETTVAAPSGQTTSPSVPIPSDSTWFWNWVMNSHL